MAYVYSDEVLEQLSRHGIRPRSDTRPALVHEYVGDLYRYEIRRLKARVLANAFPKPEYADRVIALRKRYWRLSLPVRLWADERGS